MTSAEPISFTDLSPELVEELAPRCEVRYGDEPCGCIAEWVVVLRCTKCQKRTNHFLICEMHKASLEQRRVWGCRRCGQNSTPDVVWLDQL